MSSEIWKIGQETNAQQMYEQAKIGALNNKIRGVLTLANMCNQMSEVFGEILDDQNEYLLDIENSDFGLQDLKTNLNKQIEKLMDEVKALEIKKQNGDITEEEQKDLNSKREELESLIGNFDSQIKNEKDKINEKSTEKLQENKSKVAIAKNYGEVTIEKGTPLAETEVSSGFFKKLFGCTGQDEKDAGDAAVKAGTELLEKVDISDELNNQIDKHYNSIKKI